jgi:hypothetical protein
MEMPGCALSGVGKDPYYWIGDILYESKDNPKHWKR